MKSIKARSCLKKETWYYHEDKNYPCIGIPEAVKACEIAEKEIKEKCISAFRNYMLVVSSISVSDEQADFEKLFEKMMDKI